jgi:glycosyltransferase involved in cell wall biosynthesis
MNREYILLAGWLWRALSKKVYLWSNHPSGDKLTDLASIFCNNIFCTSKFSFTAKYKKTVFMPVGVDTELFKSNSAIEKTPRSILFLSRITPIKKPDQLIRALIELRKRSVKFNASFYGNALPADEKYRQSLIETVKSSGLGDSVSFYPGIPNIQAIEIYNRHEIFVNLSPQGMYDKTIFEAMACERLILASNNNLKGIIEDKFIFKEGDKDDLAKKLEALLAEGEEQKIVDGKTLRNVVIERHSLAKLGDKLAAIIGSGTSNL